MSFIDEFRSHFNLPAEDCVLTGSRYILGEDHPDCKDWDVLVQNVSPDKFEQWFSPCSTYDTPAESGWVALRNKEWCGKDVNVIVCTPRMFTLWRHAAALCKILHGKGFDVNKWHRAMIHTAVKALA